MVPLKARLTTKTEIPFSTYNLIDKICVCVCIKPLHDYGGKTDLETLSFSEDRSALIGSLTCSGEISQLKWRI